MFRFFENSFTGSATTPPDSDTPRTPPTPDKAASACGRLRDAVKGNGSGDDQDPQSDQPQKGEKIPSQVEEPDGPEKIKDKLYSIQGEGFCVLTFLHDNEIRGDSHEDEQDAPHHREEPHGRRQWRLIHCFKGVHAVFGDPGGESACRQRDGNGSDEVFPVNIVKSVGELHGASFENVILHVSISVYCLISIV